MSKDKEVKEVMVVRPKKHSEFIRYTLIAIMGIFIGMLIMTGPKMMTGLIALDEKSEVIMLRSENCESLCDVLRPQVESNAKAVGLKFRALDYKFDTSGTPGLFIIGKGEMAPVVGFTTEQGVQQYLCQITNDKEMCDLAFPKGNPINITN